MPNHVLLVEDNVSFRSVLKAILNAKLPSVQVSEAAGEEEALEICRKNIPNLILVDLRLSDGNGYSLTRQIKLLSPGTVVVMATNHDSPEYEKAAYESGADGFISKKSASPGEIVQLVKSMAHKKRQEMD